MTNENDLDRIEKFANQEEGLQDQVNLLRDTLFHNFGWDKTEEAADDDAR